MKWTQFKIIISLGLKIAKHAWLNLLLGVKYLWCNLVGMDTYILTSVCVLDSFLKPTIRKVIYLTLVHAKIIYELVIKRDKVVLKNDV